MLTPKTYKYSKSKQTEAIKKIVEKYPTAKDFKNALLQTNDPKLKSLAQSISDQMDRYQYIDFLQYVFVKYKSHGRFLSNVLSGIGLGIIGNYLGLYIGAKNIDGSNLLSKGLDWGNTVANTGNVVKANQDLVSDMVSPIKNVGLTGAVTGVASGLGGAYLSDRIWKWHEDQKQNEIEDLKSQTNIKKPSFNYLRYQKIF